MRDVLGKGLFSNIFIRKDDLIADFIGEFITRESAEERDAEGLGGYMIQYTNDIILDSYNYTHVCKASMANCPRSCYNVKSSSSAVANARLVIDTKRYRLIHLNPIFIQSLQNTS